MKMWEFLYQGHRQRFVVLKGSTFDSEVLILSYTLNRACALLCVWNDNSRNVKRSPLKQELQTLVILTVPFNKGTAAPPILTWIRFSFSQVITWIRSQIPDVFFHKPILFLVLALRIKDLLLLLNRFTSKTYSKQGMNLHILGNSLKLKDVHDFETVLFLQSCRIMLYNVCIWKN